MIIYRTLMFTNMKSYPQRHSYIYFISVSEEFAIHIIKERNTKRSSRIGC